MPTTGITGAVVGAETGYPVVPVAHNVGTFWPRRSLFKCPGTVRVIIGPVIEAQGKTAEQIRDLAETWIENMMLELEGKG